MIHPSHAVAAGIARAREDTREVTVPRADASHRRRLLFAGLVHEHRGALYGYLRRLGASPDAAEDCLQEALVRACGRLVGDPATGGIRAPDSLAPDLADPDRARAYLYGVARHVFLDETRRRAVRERPLPEEPRDGPIDPERSAGERELLARLRSAVARLAPPRPEIVELHYGAGLGLAAIAGIVGIPEGTVKTHLHRAREELRRSLGAATDEEA
jgi:RNA polymerase sigma-70 factor (ECF subfamily)